MRISYNWLKDYIDIKMSVEKLAETLTMAGLTVDAIHDMAGDKVCEIEVTANRPDWLSYIGVARELAALTGAKLKMPKKTEDRRPKTADRRPKTRDRISVKLEDRSLCARYTARVIRNVKVGESPAWLKTRLEAMGLRSVNNIVDITNFCLFETGEPMHAFDLDRIGGKTITVRKAKNGERIKAIDGLERALTSDMLVIADGSKPVAIAGVMGGLNTEVTASTKNILLEAAYFDPISIRRTSRKLGLASESSYRFERKVDIMNIPHSSDRALGLILELAGGEAGEFIDIGSSLAAKKVIDFNFSRLHSILGLKIPPQKIVSILSALGVRIRSSSKDGIKTEVPSFRYDLNAEIDLAEEVVRVYGYDKIPETIPVIVEQPIRESFETIVDKSIKKDLAGLGFYEIITYSLLGKNAVKALNAYENSVIEIKNPLSAEQEVMRPSLAAGMFHTMLWNMNRKSGDLKLFELGNVYTKNDAGRFNEEKRLAIGMTGQVSTWATPSRTLGFFDLKGVIEMLFLKLGLENVSYKYAEDGLFSPSSCAVIELGGEEIGIMGEAARKILGDFDIKEKVYFCEICLGPVLKYARPEKRFSELAKYPSVFRDISIVVGKDAPHSGISALIKSAGSPLLKEAILIDRYAGKQIPDGKTSLTYRLEYRDPAKTLQEKEIHSIHSNVLRSLEEKFGAKLR